jgi:hypothetical protein
MWSHIQVSSLGLNKPVVLMAKRIPATLPSAATVFKRLCCQISLSSGVIRPEGFDGRLQTSRCFRTACRLWHHPQLFAYGHEPDEDVADLSAAQTPKSGYGTGRAAGYYLTSWPFLQDKWKKAGALEVAFSKDRPLELWRQIVQKLYDIKLKL